MYLRRIRDLREDADMYQREIAQYLGIDQSTYSDYESGRINIPIDMLIKLSDFYKVNLDYIVGRTDIKKPLPQTQYKSFRLYIK